MADFFKNILGRIRQVKDNLVSRVRPTYNPFSIYLPTIDETILPMNLTNITDKQMATMQEQFAEFIADVIRTELQKAINTQRFAPTWQPLSPRYLKRKKRMPHLAGRPEDMWLATGFLRDSITVWQSDNIFVVGIPNDLIHPNSKGYEVYKIAKKMEFGYVSSNGAVTPSRPLFRPVFNYVSQNMNRYMDAFFSHYRPEKQESGIKGLFMKYMTRRTPQ